MSGFELLNIDNLGKLDRGRSRHRPRDDQSLYGGPYPFVQTGDIKHAPFYINNYSQTYSERGLQQSKLWEKGTLCITIAANISDTAILNIDACFPDSIVGFTPYKDKSDVRFVKYCFDVYKTTFEAISKGTTQDNLSLDKIRSVKFKIPPLPIQRKIAAVLSAYDDLIENNTRRIAILEKMAEELYREWFVRLRFPGHEKTKIVKGVPEGWDIGSVGDLCDVKSGFAFKSEELGESGYPVIKITNIQNGYIDTFNFQRFAGNISSRIARYELFDSDLLIAMTGAQVGKCGIFIGTNERFFLNQRAGKFFNKHKIPNTLFLYLFCKTTGFVSQIDNFALGAAQPNISGGQIESIKLLIPDPNLLAQFELVLNPSFQKIICLKKQNSLLIATRDRLLSRLMSGKIDLESLDIQFPPSMREDVGRAHA